jgi:hypothetical protein
MTGPSNSVDIPGLDASAADAVAHEQSRRRMKLVFMAAFGFAALAWLFTLVVSIKSSETNGIRASWLAIFPTTFGIGGLLALDSPKMSASKALLIAFVCGVAGSFGLWFFFAGIWPSL